MSGFSGDFRWLGYQGLLINKKPIIYINPYKLAFPDVGDLILVTDNSIEHCSPDDIKWLRKGATVIVAPEGVSGKFQGDIRTPRPGDELIFNGATISIYHAPIMEFEENEIHDRVAYLINYKDGLKILYTPSLVLNPDEITEIADYLFFPIRWNDKWLFSEASHFVNSIHPKIAIPLNWDGKKDTSEKIIEHRELFEVQVELLKLRP